MLSGFRQAIAVCRLRRNTLFTRLIEMNIANADRPSLGAQKKELRQIVKARLKNLDPATKSCESGIIQGIIKDTSIFARAQALGIYVHCDKLNEVDTSELLTEALTSGTTKVYVPVVEDKDANMKFLHLDSLEGLRPVQPFNILEPTPNYCDGRPRENVMQADSPLDVLFVPGLAFDGKGHRLGRGGGYYDKFLETYLQLAKSKSWTPPLIVGLGFRSQVVDAVPVGPADRNLDCLVTADGAIIFTDCQAAISPAKLLHRD